jgi:hypothetical protein
MHWFVPTKGDHLFLGVQAKNLSDLATSSARLSALTARLHELSDPEARAVGQDLVENGALSEEPESTAALKSAVLDDPLFWEWAEAKGLNSPYRLARPEEAQELAGFDLTYWPLRLHEGGMT